MIETNRQVKFKVMTEVGIELTDALYFSEAKYASLTEKDIDALIQKRVDNFVYNYRNPPTPPEPTLEDLTATIIALSQQEEQIATLKEDLLFQTTCFEDDRIGTMPFADVVEARRVSLTLIDEQPIEIMPVLKARG